MTSQLIPSKAGFRPVQSVQSVQGPDLQGPDFQRSAPRNDEF